MTVQLDMFAEAEAAERAAVADSAPSLYASPTRGLHSRILEAQWWKGEFGSVLWASRSHAWHPGICEPTAATGRCQPTSMVAELHCDCADGCSCVGGCVFRGACRMCTWEGELRATSNEAVEDAHDHAWPGWRDLPTVDRNPGRGSGRREVKAFAAWVAAVNAVYPAGWLEAGGPIRTERLGGMRHVPAASGFGGYDLSVPRGTA